jgi:hypothetical protein
LAARFGKRALQEGEEPKSEEKAEHGVRAEEPTLSAEGAEKVGHPQVFLFGGVRGKTQYEGINPPLQAQE